MLHLCKDTAITVLSRDAPLTPLAMCRLGKFEPVSYDEAKALAAAATPPRQSKGGNREQAVKTQPVEAPQASPTASDAAEPAAPPPSTPAEAPATPAR